MHWSYLVSQTYISCGLFHKNNNFNKKTEFIVFIVAGVTQLGMFYLLWESDGFDFCGVVHVKVELISLQKTGHSNVKNYKNYV